MTSHPPDQLPTLPDYWLTRPQPDLTANARNQCDIALQHMLAQGSDEPFEYPLPIPKWQFLCHIADHHPVALHGSNLPDIQAFEPRQSVDLREFGAQLAVYAAADGIWPMYFAIVDRQQVNSIINACIRLALPSGDWLGPLYAFSISQDAFPNRPYRAGMMYVLPKETFVAEPAFPFGSLTVHSAQLASLQPVRPLAKLVIEPNDFPFMAQMRSHDDARLAEYAEAMNTAAPWPE